MTEFWTLTMPIPGRIGGIARQVEEWGFDGLVMGDSQNLAGDTWVGMGIATRETSRIGLGTGVTNPVSRHPAVTASAIAAVQCESGGRASLGIGRGDSSLAHVGERPATVDQLERFCKQVQSLLAGGEATFNGTTSRLSWLDAHDMPKVPLEVVGTGPRVLAVGARHADIVTLNVGIDPDRVAATMATTRSSCPSGRTHQLRFGAYVVAFVDDDVDVAREQSRGAVATFAHFSAMDARQRDQMPERDRQTLHRIHDTYDYRGHAHSDAPHAASLDDDFIDRFAAVGPPDRCAEKLVDLMNMGLERIVVLPGSRDGNPVDRARSAQRFATEVIPLLRG